MFYSGPQKLETVKQHLTYQIELYNQGVLYSVPIDDLNTLRNKVYHTNTCDLLNNNTLISSEEYT